jgi:biotin carboxylase
MTVFILGAGVMQIPAIDCAREMGWFAAAADGNAAAAGAVRADRFYHVDLKDLAGLEKAARALREERGLDAVFTAGTDFSASVAWLAGRLGLPGIPYEAALRASDKPRMREAFEKAGLASPRFTQVAHGADPVAAIAAAGLALPLVVKPADSMGARGCRLARTGAELVEACSLALPHSRSGRAIVEEYMEGPEFSLDAIVVDGEVRLRGFADRHIHFSPYFVELGHTMPSAFPEELKAEVFSLFAAGIKAIGITRGAAKGDMKWCPARAAAGKGGAMIGEIAARLSGGYMSGWTYPYASGIEVTREALEAAAGLLPRPVPADRAWVSAERAFISIPGRVLSIAGLRSAGSSPYIKDLFTRAGPGDSCVFPSNNVEKCGNVIAQAPDRATAEAAADGAIRGIVVRLEADRPETEAFLADGSDGRIRNPDGGTWPPAAFRLPPALAAAIEAMPLTLACAEGSSTPLVLGLPPEAKAEGFMDRDWSGRGFLESADLALGLAGARLVPYPSPATSAESVGASPRIALGRPFWSALARGGTQAALYRLDSFKGGAEA